MDADHKFKPSKLMQIISLKHILKNNAYFCRTGGYADHKEILISEPCRS